MAAVQYIWWRGFRMTPELRDAILAAEQRAGFKFSVTQGGFNAGGVLASAGTHDGDGVDFSVWEPGRVLMSRDKLAHMIEALRWAGIFASLRTGRTSLYGVRAQGFVTKTGADMPHVHGVPNGWGLPSKGARNQAAAYRNGRDGLKGNGPDAGGPGHVSDYRQRMAPMKPYVPGLPTTGDGPTATKPTTPTGGLTVSEATAILNALADKDRGLPYLSAQIKATNQSLHDKAKALSEQNRAIANGSFGRDAINARNADTAAIVQKVITAALGQVPGVDMEKVAATVKAATTQALAERDAVDADAVVARIVEKLEA